MKNISKTIVFFGTDDFSATALQGLIDAGYNIAAVVTKPDSKSGRGQKISYSSVKNLAIKHSIDVWQPNKVSDINDNIQQIDSDVIGILSSYGKIIPMSTIELFTPGIINIHPSLLPIYRGPTPIESAIKNGDKKTGVTIMQLSAGMDEGPIYGQVDYELSGKETRPELHKTLATIGTRKLIELLPSIINGLLLPKQQDNTKAIYCKLLNKQDAWLQPDQVTASAAERIVRGHLGFPKTKIIISDYTLIITKAHIVTEQKTPLDVKCSDSNYLSIDELIGPSGRVMTAQDFINGYKI